MAVQAEEALKQAVYDKALPSQHLEMGPAQRVLELLRAPFPDRKVRQPVPKHEIHSACIISCELLCSEVAVMRLATASRLWHVRLLECGMFVYLVLDWNREQIPDRLLLVPDRAAGIYVVLGFYSNSFVAFSQCIEGIHKYVRYGVLR